MQRRKRPLWKRVLFNLFHEFISEYEARCDARALFRRCLRCGKPVALPDTHCAVCQPAGVDQERVTDAALLPPQVFEGSKRPALAYRELVAGDQVGPVTQYHRATHWK